MLNFIIVKATGGTGSILFHNPGPNKALVSTYCCGELIVFAEKLIISLTSKWRSEELMQKIVSLGFVLGQVRESHSLWEVVVELVFGNLNNY